MQLFYSQKYSETEFLLSNEESKHCIKTLRKKSGDTILITDGKGFIYECAIIDDNMQSCKAEIVKTIETPFSRNYKLHIAISPLKNPDRFEWFIEKATEIGIDEITPIICKRTEKTKINIERINRIAISALKQSLQTTLPIINQPISIEKFIALNKNGSYQKFIAWCETDKKLLLKDEYKAGSQTIIMIGPEGDFTNEEVELAKTSEFKPISLGNARFRTETAAITACHTVFIINQ